MHYKYSILEMERQHLKTIRQCKKWVKNCAVEQFQKS